jgi:7-cyano-7-deazaguanine reductase
MNNNNHKGPADWDSGEATAVQSMLGRVVAEPLQDPLKIEVVPVPLEVGVVEYYTSELSALCPVTGQPDQYEAVIRYEAKGGTLESKALKHYLWSFRDRGIFCETLAAEIAASLSDLLQGPVTVKLRQQVRGGLTLSATAVGGNT